MKKTDIPKKQVSKANKVSFFSSYFTSEVSKKNFIEY